MVDRCASKESSQNLASLDLREPSLPDEFPLGSGVENSLGETS